MAAIATKTEACSAVVMNYAPAPTNLAIRVLYDWPIARLTDSKRLSFHKEKART
jgi:hypothetical protein